MKQRIFVALTVSNRLQRNVESWQKNLKDLPLRLMRGKNLHITLIPPWYVEDPENAISILKKVRGIKPFKVGFEKITYGPRKYKPRLIWANGQEKDEIIRLKKEIGKILKKKEEKREYLLHLTIARFKPEDYDNFPVKELNEKIAWKETFSSFCLMRSHIKRGGADYEVIKNFPF